MSTRSPGTRTRPASKTQRKTVARRSSGSAFTQLKGAPTSISSGAKSAFTGLKGAPTRIPSSGAKSSFAGLKGAPTSIPGGRSSSFTGLKGAPTSIGSSNSPRPTGRANAITRGSAKGISKKSLAFDRREGLASPMSRALPAARNVVARGGKSKFRAIGKAAPFSVQDLIPSQLRTGGLRDAMQTGADRNNPLKKILRGNK